MFLGRSKLDTRSQGPGPHQDVLMPCPSHIHRPGANQTQQHRADSSSHHARQQSNSSANSNNTTVVPLLHSILVVLQASNRTKRGGKLHSELGWQIPSYFPTSIGRGKPNTAAAAIMHRKVTHRKTATTCTYLRRRAIVIHNTWNPTHGYRHLFFQEGMKPKSLS
jgi:hypothetical protein